MRVAWKSWIFVLALSGAIRVSLGAAPAWASSEYSAIEKFHQVSEGIYRGGRPTREGLRDLAALGIKTLVNLESDSFAVADETSEAERLGLQEISEPMGSFLPPSDAQMDLILSLIADPELRPVFVHCHYGQDRTGLVIGLYRVLYEKRPAAEAYSEMLSYGFSSYLLFPLDHYFRARTGL